MALTIRQKIVDAIEAKLRLILVANGYETNAGNNVFVWRSVPFNPSELPALILRDLDEPIEEHTRYSERHQRSLHIQVEVIGAGTTADDTYRKLLADVEKAIKTGKLAERKGWWANADGNPLAYKTRPRLSRMVVEQESKKVAGGFFECFVDYISRDFDSYE